MSVRNCPSRRCGGALPLLLCLLAARAFASPLPRGLLPAALQGPRKEVHDSLVRQLSTRIVDVGALREGAVSHDAVLVDACEKRLAVLRGLVLARDFEAAVDLSFALDAASASLAGGRAHLPAACRADRPLVGVAAIVAKVASPPRRGVPGARANRTVSVSVRAGGVDHGPFPISAGMTEFGFGASAEDLPVVGAIIDGDFVGSRSAMRCAERAQGDGLECKLGDEHLHYVDAAAAADAAEHKKVAMTRAARARRRSASKTTPAAKVVTRPVSRASRAAGALARVIDDEASDYVVGTKKMLVIPVCASDSGDCAADFDYGLVSSAYGGSVENYLEAMVSLANEFWAQASWGVFQVEATISPVVQIDYTKAGCGLILGVDSWTGGDAADSAAYDVMAFAAAKAAGYDVDDYDFNVVVVPHCKALGWSGVGWVGYPGLTLNLIAEDLDGSLVHEMGHNFGAYHASFANADGSRGGVAWWSIDASWGEYANDYTVMGDGEISQDDISAHYLVEGKLIFDWLDDSYVQDVEPYDDKDSPNCSPCGPYLLQPADDGALENDGSFVAIQIAAETALRFLFVEYRAALGGAVLTWTDYSPTSGATGTYLTLLADASPGTSDMLDSVLYAGGSFVADFGTEANVGVRWVTISASTDAATGRFKIQVVSSETSQPTTTPAPSTSLAPTLAPSAADERCGGDSCCDELVSSGVTFNKVRFSNDPDHYCCSGHCTYEDASKTYALQWVQARGLYFIMPIEYDSCITGRDAWAYFVAVTELEIEAACALGAPTPQPTAPPPTFSPTFGPTPSPTFKPTPSPTFGPTPSPTPRPTPRPSSPAPGQTAVGDDCTDSATWFKDGQPNKPCDWVANDVTRCDKEDAEGVSAMVGCPATCNDECNDEGNDGGCTDSATWFKDGQPEKPCGWVAKDVTRCDKEDADGVSATDGCPATCKDECNDEGSDMSDIGCTDSATWFKDGQPEKPCGWVAKDVTRCDNEDADGVSAIVGCAATCNDERNDEGNDMGDGGCTDSATWFKDGQPEKPCGWVAKDVTRCDNEDGDGVSAIVGCPATCNDECNDEGNDMGDGGCTDSATWFKDGQPEKPCGWVAADVTRCDREDAEGVAATDGCAATCGTCNEGSSRTRGKVDCADMPAWVKGGHPKIPCIEGTSKIREEIEDCADSPTWFKGGQPKKSCAWVAGNILLRCQKSDLDGVTANDGCPAACGSCNDDAADDDADVAANVAADDCADSATWLKGGQPKKTCDWVAQDVTRCNREDAEGVSAMVGCAATCDPLC
ncbi:hypothetical protein M885DRAFT_455639 [Pelagophyceae sp. CCMP2097]|nr:hypothetical protein M885DRAFT_455639 [Pelagophyceae sp. CCMP2097]